MRLLRSSAGDLWETGLSGFYVQLFNGLIIILALLGHGLNKKRHQSADGSPASKADQENLIAFSETYCLLAVGGQDGGPRLTSPVSKSRNSTSSTSSIACRTAAPSAER